MQPKAPTRDEHQTADPGLDHAEFSSPCDLASLRHRCADALYAAGRTDGHVSAVLVVLSELATNALCHDDPPYAVRIEVAESASLVEVTDAGRGRVATRVPALAQGGYGLNLVNMLAASWGVKSRRDGPGKRVWAVIARDREL